MLEFFNAVKIKALVDIDGALDHIYSNFDTWFLEGRFDLVDSVLDVCCQDIPWLLDNGVIAVGFLTATAPASHKLAKRAGLFHLLKGTVVDSALLGLE